MRIILHRYGSFLNLCNTILVIFLFIAGSLKAETILTFGDSLTQGYGLPAEEGFVPQMGAWLKKQGISAKMINAGVSGDTTAGGLARLDWTLAEPVDLIIVNLGSNDMLRGLDPLLVYNNLNQIIDKLQKRQITTLLIGHRAPLNYGTAYKKAFDRAFEKLAINYDVHFYPFFLKVLMGPDEVSPELHRYFQPDGLHPNANGVAALVTDIGPYILRALSK